MGSLRDLEKKRQEKLLESSELDDFELLAEVPSISPWDEPEKLGVSQGVFEPVWSRKHVEEVLGASQVTVEPPVIPPPQQTGEHVPADCVGMFIEGYYRQKWGVQENDHD